MSVLICLLMRIACRCLLVICCRSPQSRPELPFLSGQLAANQSGPPLEAMLLRLRVFWAVVLCSECYICCHAHPTRDTEPAASHLSLDILRRPTLPRNGADRSVWARERKIALNKKYNVQRRSALGGRASGMNLYVLSMIL